MSFKPGRQLRRVGDRGHVLRLGEERDQLLGFFEMFAVLPGAHRVALAAGERLRIAVHHRGQRHDADFDVFVHFVHFVRERRRAEDEGDFALREALRHIRVFGRQDVFVDVAFLLHVEQLLRERGPFLPVERAVQQRRRIVRRRADILRGRVQIQETADHAVIDAGHEERRDFAFAVRS